MNTSVNIAGVIMKNPVTARRRQLQKRNKPEKMIVRTTVSPAIQTPVLTPNLLIKAIPTRKLKAQRVIRPHRQRTAESQKAKAPQAHRAALPHRRICSPYLKKTNYRLYQIEYIIKARKMIYYITNAN